MEFYTTLIDMIEILLSCHSSLIRRNGIKMALPNNVGTSLCDVLLVISELYMPKACPYIVEESHPAIPTYAR